MSRWNGCREHFVMVVSQFHSFYRINVYQTCPNEKGKRKWSSLSNGSRVALCCKFGTSSVSWNEFCFGVYTPQWQAGAKNTRWSRNLLEVKRPSISTTNFSPVLIWTQIVIFLAWSQLKISINNQVVKALQKFCMIWDSTHHSVMWLTSLSSRLARKEFCEKEANLILLRHDLCRADVYVRVWSMMLTGRVSQKTCSMQT